MAHCLISSLCLVDLLDAPPQFWHGLFLGAYTYCWRSWHSVQSRCAICLSLTSHVPFEQVVSAWKFLLLKTWHPTFPRHGQRLQCIKQCVELIPPRGINHIPHPRTNNYSSYCLLYLADLYMQDIGLSSTKTHFSAIETWWDRDRQVVPVLALLSPKHS